MKFTRKSGNLNPINDTVFAVSRLAEKDRQNYPNETINATIGSLYDESGKLVAYDSVFTHYDEIDARSKASYAKSFLGNPDFLDACQKWILKDQKINLFKRIVATPGGTGAIATSLHCFLDQGETVILPNIAWGSYSLMANMYGLKAETYEMFEQDHFNLASLSKTIEKVQNYQDHIVLVLNDPCHNPTGYSLSNEEWKELIDLLNKVSKKTPVVLINDIAYIDYAYNLNHSRDYMSTWNSISENILISVCFSCSKTLTSYGLRCGAALLLSKDEKDVIDATVLFEKFARSTWSNIPNAAMINFVNVTTTFKVDFEKEKNKYVNLLKNRSQLFLSEAKTCGLPCYPYKEGFFITIKLEDPKMKENYHQALMDHHIYTVQVQNGIRVAICSLSQKQIEGLAFKMQEILHSLEN